MIMISKSKIGSLSLVVALSLVGGTAQADNFNTSGVICHNYNASEATDIDYFGWGVTNVNSLPRWVTCAVPHPRFLAASPAPLYIDGLNNLGATTSCTATWTDFDGGHGETTPLFTETAPHWDQPITFTTMPPQWAYISVTCLLPPNRGGGILGITTLQP
jgi:hypothetical protein